MCCCNQEVSSSSTRLGYVKVRRSSLKLHNKASTGVSRKSKRVRFSSKDNVATRHATLADLKASWCSQVEFEGFKKECRKTAQLYAKVEGDITRIDPDKVCLRGLETHLTRESMMRRRLTIVNSIRAVLNEHRTQKALGKEDPNRLKEISSALSAFAIKRAEHMADFDAKLCKLF